MYVRVCLTMCKYGRGWLVLKMAPLNGEESPGTSHYMQDKLLKAECSQREWRKYSMVPVLLDDTRMDQKTWVP